MTSSNQEQSPRFSEYEDALLTGASAHTYRKLHEVLREPPAPPLPTDFAIRVTDRVFQQPTVASYSSNVGVVTVLAVALSLLLSALIIYYADATMFKSVVQQLWQVKEIVAFATAILILVQWGDQWIMRRIRS